jgi:heat shock protein HtpX
MPEVRTAEARDATGDIVLLAAGHAVVLALVALVLGVLLLPVALAVAAAVVIGVGATAWRLHRVDERIASALRARRVRPGEDRRLESLVDSVAMAVGVAPPAVHLIETSSCNAVAWGSGTGRVSCAFTTGLLEALDRIQLEAVIAHQFALVRDSGVDEVSLGAALLGPVARGPLVAPVASLVHRRVRDRSVVLADLEGVRATRYPPGLVAALDRLRRRSTSLASIPLALSALCFAPPEATSGPFSVHPPIEDRIDLLREI